MSTDTDAALRVWAKGIYPLEAATELLLRTGFAGPTRPWVRHEEHPDGTHYWIDFAAIPDLIGGMSGGEQRLLGLAASLGSSQVPVNLSDAISGLDRAWVALILAALSHASGAHEHMDITVVDGEDLAFLVSAGAPLVPWPDPEA